MTLAEVIVGKLNEKFNFPIEQDEDLENYLGRLGSALEKGLNGHAPMSNDEVNIAIDGVIRENIGDHTPKLSITDEQFALVLSSVMTIVEVLKRNPTISLMQFTNGLVSGEQLKIAMRFLEKIGIVRTIDPTINPELAAPYNDLMKVLCQRSGIEHVDGELLPTTYSRILEHKKQTEPDKSTEEHVTDILKLVDEVIAEAEALVKDR